MTKPKTFVLSEDAMTLRNQASNARRQILAMLDDKSIAVDQDTIDTIHRLDKQFEECENTTNVTVTSNKRKLSRATYYMNRIIYGE